MIHLTICYLDYLYLAKKTTASAMRISFLGHKENDNGRNNEQYSFNVDYNCTIFYLNFEMFL